MKKSNKVLSICFAILLVAAASITGTLAYTTYATDENGGNKTSESVKVSLIKERRVYDEDGKVISLEQFKDNKQQLAPLVGSAQYNGSNFDKYGMPTAEGYVDMIVRVKNEDQDSAYVRVIVAIPSALDDANDAGKNALHWTLGNRFMPDGKFSADNSRNAAYENISWERVRQGVDVEGIESNIYIFTYQEPLGREETTRAAAFVGFYLDRSVNIVNGHVYLDGVDTGYTEDNVKIYVKAQAVQRAGFDSAKDAFESAGLPDNPWNDELDNS